MNLCAIHENYENVCGGYVEFIKAIAEFEPVTLIVNPGEIEQVRSFALQNVEFLTINHNDSWIRDNGPTFLTGENGKLAGVNWIFNAWGGKYFRWDEDNLVASKVLDHYDIKCFDAPLIMEGGSFHVDGEGTLITTEQCLLNPNRNPKLNKRAD